MCYRIRLLQNEEARCYACHFDLKLTIFSSGLPTFVRDLLSQDIPLRFVIIISSLPQQQIMAAQTPQQVEHGTESSRRMGASANTPPAETQPQRRHQLAHRNAATAATEQMTLDAQSRIVRKTGSGKNKKQRTIGCEYS